MSEAGFTVPGRFGRGGGIKGERPLSSNIDTGGAPGKQKTPRRCHARGHGQN